MKYYKVKPESDQVRIDRPNSRKIYILVRNELFTAKEAAKKGFTTPFLAKHFDLIEVNKNTTYIFFGARHCTKFPYQQSK